MSDTIRLIAEFLQPASVIDCVCAAVPGAAEILPVLRTGRCLRLDLL